MANEPHTEPQNIKIEEELCILQEKQLNRKEVSIGKQKGTSGFYSDKVTSSISKETVAKKSTIEYSADKCKEQIALNNPKNTSC